MNIQNLPSEILCMVGTYLDPRVSYLLRHILPWLRTFHKLPATAGAHLTTIPKWQYSDVCLSAPGKFVSLPLKKLKRDGKNLAFLVIIHTFGKNPFVHKLD